MIVVHNYSTAVIMSIITMLCWGSWANTQKLSSKTWCFQNFYWDYSFGVLILSLIFAFTMGSIGTQGRSFILDLSQASMRSLSLAFISGVLFNLANILLVYAIDIVGMAVAFPVGIGLALVIGVIANYISLPLGNGWLLFIGVAAVVVAIVIDALAYKKIETTHRKNKNKGIIISIICGILMGFFYPFIAAAMGHNFAHPEIGKITPYTATVIFSIGLLASNFIFNTILMKLLIKEKYASLGDYFRQGNIRLHLIGIFGGVIWCIGLAFSLIAAGPAGYAISYGLGQGATMIAALWGVFIWKEFKSATKPVNSLLAWMFIFYLAGLILVILARVI